MGSNPADRLRVRLPFTGEAFQSLVAGIDEHLADPGGAPWKILLTGLSRAFAMISPVLLAVLASRQVEM